MESRLAAITAAISRLAADPQMTEAELMRALRLNKAEAHLIIALADLAGEAPTATTVRRLSAPRRCLR